MDNSFLVIVSVGVAVLAGYYILCGTKKPEKKAAAPKKTSAAVPKRPSGPPKDYTMEEVAKHNTKADLWLVVEGKIYDVSSFVPTHPGGDAIMRHPGQDNTATIFHDQHPESVRDQLNEFFIGNVKK